MMDWSWLTLDTWITSDHHWGHDNIRKMQSRPWHHEELMERLWRERVQGGDAVLHLGDVVYANRGRFDDAVIKAQQEMLRSLPGRKFLILGNHDKLPYAWYERAGFEVVGRKPVLWVSEDPDLIACFSHEPHHDGSVEWTGDLPWDVNVHGHIHANPYYSQTPHRDYRNVCVEVTGFAPVRLRDVLAGTVGHMKLGAAAPRY